jgi:hypothetical protein
LFKWIKQHLRIKAFFGTSENAVKTQIWIAVATYVLIAIVKKRALLPHSLYELLQILSLTMFETTPINQTTYAPTADTGRRSTTRSPMTDVGTLLSSPLGSAGRPHAARWRGCAATAFAGDASDQYREIASNSHREDRAPLHQSSR